MLSGSSSTLQMSSMAPQSFPSLGPALMVSMGYIDLGKWVAAVEGGACFGVNAVLLVIFLNLCAIFCQYLSTSVSLATGRNLAQIYSKEYRRSICMMLGLQAEVSAVALDTSTILGIAYGINILSGLDILMCVIYSAVGLILLPFFATHYDNAKAEILYMAISVFVLTFYVLGVLISQPEIPLAMSWVFPRLSGETAYSLMALLGSNIMVHNFYTHSSIVEQQRRLPNIAVGASSHDHLFAILFVFSGIFLVNYVLMNSAAASVFENAGFGMSTFQDVFLLLDQVFGTPIPPIAFLLVLLFSSLVTSLSWNIGGQLVLHELFHIDLSALVHQLFMRTFAATLALYYAQVAGAEGIYQLLVFCQIVSAMLLPSSVIPLFRVASSRSLMGDFNIAWYLEVFALLAFVGILAVNIIFITELTVGNSSWIIALRGNGGGSLSLQFIVIFLVSCLSLVLVLYLAVTPLNSSRYGADAQRWTWNLQVDQQPKEDNEVVDPEKIDYGEAAFMIEPVESLLQNPSDSQYEQSVSAPNFDGSDIAIDYNRVPQQSVPISESNSENSDLQILPLDIVDKLPASSILEGGIVHDSESNACIDWHSQIETNRNFEKENKGDSSEHESSKCEIPALQAHGTGPSRNSKVKSEVLSGTSVSIPKMSGLGRATRRQFASILDEFWGHLFDFHGKVTQEAAMKRFDILLGLDTHNLLETQKASGSLASARDYISSKTKNISKESPFLELTGSTSWASNMESLNPPAQSPWQGLLEAGKRRYSSLHLPQNADNWGYQPATVHGYLIPSSLRGLHTSRYAGATSIPLESATPRCTGSFSSSYMDRFTCTTEQGSLNSLSPSDPQISRIKNLAERQCYESPFLDTNITSSVYDKKYHSLPDISGLAISSRLAASNDQNAKLDGSIISNSKLPIGRISREHPLYSRPFTGAKVATLSFDELSTSRTYGNVFSVQSSTMPETKSLWSRQPFQIFGLECRAHSQEIQAANRISSTTEETFAYAESETKILQSLKLCILKLLKLEGSDWLFRRDGGADEELINQLAAKEWFLSELDASEVDQYHFTESLHSCTKKKLTSSVSYEEIDVADLHPLCNCGKYCIWRMSLIVNFGVWCILRVLELSLVESRPELWGKYTYVLNRLQGILEPAFSKVRSPPVTCPCLSIPAAHKRPPTPPSQDSRQFRSGRTHRGTCTSAIIVLELIKDVEAAISNRKGRTGTAAGDIAFPKGKENLASVLKRYKRRLSNKSPGSEVNSSRKVPLPPPSF